MKWVVILLAALLLLGSGAAASACSRRDAAFADEEAIAGSQSSRSGASSVEAAAHDDHGAGALGVRLPLWSALPFVGILLSIALIPILAPHFWHMHYPKVAMAWAAVFGVPFLLSLIHI